MQGNNAAAITPGRLSRRLDPRIKLALLPDPFPAPAPVGLGLPHGLGMGLPEPIHI